MFWAFSFVSLLNYMTYAVVMIEMKAWRTYSTKQEVLQEVQESGGVLGMTLTLLNSNHDLALPCGFKCWNSTVEVIIMLWLP